MLKGKKVYLRTIEPFDADTLLDWENDTNNWRISGTKVPFSKHLINLYVNNAQDVLVTKQIRFMICLKDTDVAIGTIDLFDFESFHQHAGVGVLVAADYRGKGVATEALLVLENYALNNLGIRNLHCAILGDNEASKQLFTQANYQLIGCYKNWFNDKGNWIDEYRYQKQLVK